MRNILFGIVFSVMLVVGSVSAIAGSAGDSATSAVSWSLGSFVELTINSSSFDFGELDPGTESVLEKNAVRLMVRSNTSWALSYSVDGVGADHLVVDPRHTSGHRNMAVNVDYELVDLLDLDPGDYSVTVTFTVTAD